MVSRTGELNGCSYQSEVQLLVGKGVAGVLSFVGKRSRRGHKCLCLTEVDTLSHCGTGGNEHLSLARGRFAGRMSASQQW